MAKHEVTVFVCDKCGFEDQDPEKFRHVEISELRKKGLKVISSRDLCMDSCLGAPGVNRDKV